MRTKVSLKLSGSHCSLGGTGLGAEGWSRSPEGAGLLLCVTAFQVSEGIQESRHPCDPGKLPLVSPGTVSKPLLILPFSLDVHNLLLKLWFADQ